MSFVTKLFGGKKVDTSQAQFQPYSISGPLGGVAFDRGAKTGKVSLTPEVQQFMDLYLRGAKEMLPSATDTQFATDISTYGKGLFGQATGQDLNKLVSDEYQRQLKLLQPERTAEDIRLRESLYGTGRTGAALSLGTGGYVQPELYSQQLAREQANLGLMSNIDQLMRERQIEDLQRGIGLYGMGEELRLSPYAQSYGLFSQAAGIPSLVDPYLSQGISAGSASATAGANVASLQEQQRQSNLGFWGNLIGGGLSVLGKPSGGSSGLFSSFSNPFASAPPKVGSTDFWKGTPSFSWSSPSTWF